jgi:hypothetical protein
MVARFSSLKEKQHAGRTDRLQLAIWFYISEECAKPGDSQRRCLSIPSSERVGRSQTAQPKFPYEGGGFHTVFTV